MLEGDFALFLRHVPDLDGVVERGRREDVLGARVELQVADLACVAHQGALRLHVDNVFRVDVHVRVVLRDIPDEDLAVLARREHPLLVERVEGRVEHAAARVASEHRHLVRRLAHLVHGDHRERPDSVCIQRDVHPVALDDVAVKRRQRRLEVFVAELLLEGLPVHVSELRRSHELPAHPASAASVFVTRVCTAAIDTCLRPSAPSRASPPSFIPWWLCFCTYIFAVSVPHAVLDGIVAPHQRQQPTTEQPTWPRKIPRKIPQKSC